MARRTNPPRRAVRQKLTTSSASLPRGARGARGPRGKRVRTHQPPAVRRRPPRRQKLLMCLDYGTAFTSISYIVFDPADPPLDVGPSAVQSVRDWPQATGHFHAGNACVPSESWYRDGQQYLWGHAVQQTLRTMSEEDVASTNRVVQLAKLLLDYDHGDDDDDDDRDQSGASGDPLLEIKNVLRNVGKTAKEVVKDYLTQVFRHAHQQLARREGFNRSWEVELALCVPSKWSTYAHLTMQEIALEVTAATGMQAGGDFSLFIIDEPEAAVTFALRYDHIRDRIEEDSNFIVCDAGGGTVDAITYRVRQEDPFRFDEIAIPAGKDCGSSYINQALSEEAKRRLANVSGLGSETVYSKEAVIHHDLFRAFEQEVKRAYDPAEMDEGERIAVRLWGLRADPDKDFGHGIFFITKEQMENYFRRSLQGTVDLINQQLSQVDAKTVKVLLLVGGFSRSTALRNRLEREFPRLKVVHLGNDIDMDTAVSRGGVLRALNKEDGPHRKLRLNLGVCITEEYNPKFEGHVAGPSFHHPLNGKEYVKECIEWAIRKDRVLGEKTKAKILMHRVFDVDEEMAAEETLYFSDQMVYQHYRKDHWRNNGHRQAGVVAADLEFIRENDLIQPKVNESGNEYYEVNYSLELEVDGHNMKASIRYPPGQQVQGVEQICIAAAFKPGTR